MEATHPHSILAVDLEIRRVSSAGIFAEPAARGLFDEYAAGCSIPEIGAIDPQPKMYAAMEEAGMFRLFGAFLGGELIGFASLLVYILPHYGEKIATVESMFVSEIQRPSGAGMKLIGAIETHAKEQGCAAILYSSPVGSQFERLLQLRSAYRQTSSVFCRRLR